MVLDIILPAHLIIVGFVTITDNDDQSIEIAIAHVKAEVTEGNPARFVISSETIAPKADLTINVNEERTGDFFNSSVSTSVTLGVGVDYKRLSIITVDDGDYEQDGRVTITIETSINYSIANAPHNSATVQINDNDVRPLRSEIHIAPRNRKVTEGNPARFLFVSEDVIPTSQLIINIKVTFTGDFFNTIKPTTQIFDQGDEFSYLDIPTIDDDEIDDNGSVKIEVLAGTNYYIAKAPHNIATVQVLEDIEIPRIYIQAVTKTINEGQIAKFEIISESIAPPSNLLINLAVTQVGSYHLNTLPEEVTMAGGTKKVPLNLSTVDDDFDRPDGRLSVVLKAGTGYKPVSGNGSNKPNAEISIKNTDTEVEVQVFTSTARITEGEFAQFEIRASRNVVVTRLVNINITVQGNFHSGFPSGVNKDFVLPIVTGKSVAQFVLQAQPNEIDQANGSITFRLETGNEYNVAAAPLDSTVVIIEDDDGPPMISVSNANSVIEGSKAVFPVTAVGTSTVDVIVLFSLDEGNRDFLGGRAKEIAKLNAQSVSTTLSVQTVADGFDESDGMITVTIDPDPLTPDSYIVGSANTATVLVIDDDKPPEMSILDAPEIIEGNQSSFTLITTRVSSDLVSIKVSIDNGTNDYLVGVPATTITLPPKASLVILNIDTEDDNEDEPDGDIDVTILADTKNPPTYTVGSKNTATGKVIDNDIFTFSINSKQLRYEEHESVQFSINASIISRRDIPISIQLTESAEYLAVGEQVEQFIVKAGERISQQFITLDDDNLIERNGTVTATVLDDPSYKLEGRDNFSVLIIDNDDPPLLSVIAESTEVRPNSTLDFKIMAEESITKDELMIKISVDQNSNFIKWRTPKTIMLKPLKQEQLYQFATNSTFNEVNNGRIKISILEDESVPSKYRVKQGAKEITISVMDLSNVPRVEPTTSPRISIADSVVNSILNLNLEGENSPTPTRHREQRISTFEFNSNLKRKSILPTIQIVAISNTIEVGEPAKFQLKSSTKVIENLVVHLSQKTSGNFTNSFTIEYVEIPREKNIAIIEIPTINDRQSESDGFIEISIVSNSKYHLGENSVARVNIIDSADRILRQQILESVNNEFIPRFLRASTQNSFNIAEQRIKSAFTSGIENSISLNRSRNYSRIFNNLWW